MGLEVRVMPESIKETFPVLSNVAGLEMFLKSSWDLQHIVHTISPIKVSQKKTHMTHCWKINMFSVTGMKSYQARSTPQAAGTKSYHYVLLWLRLKKF